MKKEYIKPEAEKIMFDYSENVTACTSFGEISYETRDINQINYECHEHYADNEHVCGQDGHNVSNPYYRCRER